MGTPTRRLRGKTHSDPEIHLSQDEVKSELETMPKDVHVILMRADVVDLLLAHTACSEHISVSSLVPWAKQGVNRVGKPVILARPDPKASFSVFHIFAISEWHGDGPLPAHTGSSTVLPTLLPGDAWPDPLILWRFSKVRLTNTSSPITMAKQGGFRGLNLAKYGMHAASFNRSLLKFGQPVIAFPPRPPSGAVSGMPAPHAFTLALSPPPPPNALIPPYYLQNEGLPNGPTSPM
eukprot:5823921-Pyramimonas_sp.AAC.1